jgi:DNA-directed RNA polymerase subunit A"
MCAGSNLKEVLKMKEVDAKLTVSNNIFEVASVLGIEAARQAIINECVDVLENQGLDVDIRHVMFLADLMTHTGGIRGITRGGISGEKESILARASFETPTKHIVNASLTGGVDKIRSVIENVMINQPVPIGTGLPGLVAKVKETKK